MARAGSPFQGFRTGRGPLLHCIEKPSVLLAHFPGLDKGPRAFIVDAAEILLHIGDVGLEIPPDQVRENGGAKFDHGSGGMMRLRAA